MQRYDVEPDEEFYAALIAVAGKAGKLDLAFETLVDMSASGVQPNSTSMSALIQACLMHGDLQCGRRVYELALKQNIPPSTSVYNRMMDWYAVEHRFGDVVSLVSDMVKHGRDPNLNSYRVIFNACQRCYQPQLAAEVYSIMRAKKIPILQKKMAHTMYYTLIKTYYNQIRQMWEESAGPDAGREPWRLAQSPAVRQAEAEVLLRALAAANRPEGFTGMARPATPINLGRSLTLPPDSINWAQLAIGLYRDMVLDGHQPNLDILDKLMACLRLPLAQFVTKGAVPEADRSHANSAANGIAPPQVAASAQGAIAAAAAAGQPLSPEDLIELAHLGTPQPVAQKLEASMYEVAFDRRTFSILEDAANRGQIASYKAVDEAPMTLDLRSYPPTLAEVMVLGLLNAVEKRVARTGQSQFKQQIEILVPPFCTDYITWPSYVERLNFHYDEGMSYESDSEDMSGSMSGSYEENHEPGNGNGSETSSYSGASSDVLYSLPSNTRVVGSPTFGAPSTLIDDEDDPNPMCTTFPSPPHHLLSCHNATTFGEPSTLIDDEDEYEEVDVFSMQGQSPPTSTPTLTPCTTFPSPPHHLLSCHNATTFGEPSTLIDDEDEYEEVDVFSMQASALQEPPAGMGGIMTMSELAREVRSPSTASTDSSASSGTASSSDRFTDVTGLAVAATCRRMKIFAKLDGHKGVITMAPGAISRWAIVRHKLGSAFSSATGSLTTQPTPTQYTRVLPHRWAIVRHKLGSALSSAASSSSSESDSGKAQQHNSSPASSSPASSTSPQAPSSRFGQQGRTMFRPTPLQLSPSDQTRNLRLGLPMPGGIKGTPLPRGTVPGPSIGQGLSSFGPPTPPKSGPPRRQPPPSPSDY
eukprot:gene4335-14448_t